MTPADDATASNRASGPGPWSDWAPAEDTTAEDRDLPLDAHLHTDQSPDSSVPIDVYAALAVERGIPEIAITDHVDFDPRDPAYEYTLFEDRERVVRRTAERWAKEGVVIRFGAELTYNRRWEDELRDHLRRYRYDYVIGSVHDWPESPVMIGVIGVSERPVSKPSLASSDLKRFVLAQRRSIRQGSSCMTRIASRQAAASAGGCEVENRNGRARWIRSSRNAVVLAT